MAYNSPIPYEEARIHAAAVYCSDGRVGEHFDDFLQNGLGLPRYDRLALPGGPASLAGYSDSTIEAQAVMDELNFLVEAHGLKRVVLIQHEGCAFYRMRLGLTSEQIVRYQDDDLSRAAQVIAEHTGLSNIEGYFAARADKGIHFRPVAISLDPQHLVNRG
ncbi:MAG: carbonic anhydrase [Phycisphaerales bacterium]